jgi:hypothetical protein
MEETNITPLYIKIPSELKTALTVVARNERTSLVGLCTDILTTGVNARSKVNEKRIKQLIDSSRVFANGQD